MRIKMRLAAVSVAALAAAALSATAGAGTIPVSGTQTVIDEQTGQYEMHGSLVGKWNVTAFKELYKNPSAYAARGTEKFNGCIDVDANGTCEATEPTGTMSFAFIYWATFDPKTSALIRGGCVHPVSDGTGGLAGAKGIILMKDTPVGNGVRTTYTGTLTIPSVRNPAGRALAGRSPQGCGR